jgi:hypothetical protein
MGAGVMRRRCSRPRQRRSNFAEYGSAARRADHARGKIELAPHEPRGDANVSATPIEVVLHPTAEVALLPEPYTHRRPGPARARMQVDCPVGKPCLHCTSCERTALATVTG